MRSKGIDLGSYDGVKKNALQIYAHTASGGDMPPDTAGKWSDNRHQTFLNWITNKYPLGTAAPQPPPAPVDPAAPTMRLRKNVTSLSKAEIDLLKTAFAGLMARDPTTSDSYFGLAGLHGLPGAWCAHHIDQFNPWHRVYMRMFEDALRSVKGCDSVTLPYWDVSKPLPALFNEAPFASYELPLDPGATADPPQPNVYFPLTTSRYDAATISSNMVAYGVLDDISTAAVQTMWGAYNTNGYQDFSIQAHDGGHVATGTTMANQDISAFDPVFWFYHCNIDRLWLAWQQKVGATTLAGFETTIDGDKTWLAPPLNPLPPFATTSDESIVPDVTYEELEPMAKDQVAFENLTGSLAASRSFKIGKKTPVSVRVKDIARLNIPGSFEVVLLADGKPIAKRAFFQPKAPRSCATCAKQALVNIDFRLDQSQILDRKLSVAIQVPGHADRGVGFPLSSAGDPSVNVRMLLQDH